MKGIDLSIDDGMGGFTVADTLGLEAVKIRVCDDTLRQLRAQNAEFENRIYPPADGVYLAVGHAASNVGMIVGNSGAITSDTAESTKAAERILAAFRQITGKPITTIIYTHSHRDHISGARVFAEGRGVKIVAHLAFESYLVGADDRRGPQRPRPLPQR